MKKSIIITIFFCFTVLLSAQTAATVGVKQFLGGDTGYTAAHGELEWHFLQQEFDNDGGVLSVAVDVLSPHETKETHTTTSGFSLLLNLHHHIGLSLDDYSDYAPIIFTWGTGLGVLVNGYDKKIQDRWGDPIDWEYTYGPQFLLHFGMGVRYYFDESGFYVDSSVKGGMIANDNDVLGFGSLNVAVGYRFEE